MYCLARIQNDRGGWQPQATLNRSLACQWAVARRRPGRPAHSPCAEQPEAAEGVAVQPDGRAQIREGVGIVGQGLLGQLHLGEANHRMGPLAVRPAQAELAGQATN